MLRVGKSLAIRLKLSFVDHSRKSDPVDLHFCFQLAVNSGERDGSCVDDAGERLGDEAGDAFSDAFEESSGAFLASSGDWFLDDTGNSAEETAEELFSCSRDSFFHA